MWYRNSFRRNLIDMHIADSDERFMSEFDPKTYADMMELAQVDTAIVYASSCLGNCYWPTKVGHMHQGLKGRDIFGETIGLLKRKNIHTVAYVNYWSRRACLDHPDWQMRDAKGRATLEYLWNPGRYGVCCPNSPYREFFLSHIEELCRDYEFDGVWVDMVGWFAGVCHCAHCRKRYLHEAGRDFPAVVNWEDPEWVGFQRRREAWLSELGGQIAGAVKRLKPDASVAIQSGIWAAAWSRGCTSEYLAQSDYLAGDFYGHWLIHHAFNCMGLNSLTRNRPIEFMTSCHASLEDHTTKKAKPFLEAQVYSALTHAASFVFIDAIDPAGTINRQVYEEMGELYKEIRRYERHIDASAPECTDVGVYFNFESLIDTRLNGTKVEDASPSVPLVGVLENIVKSLLDAHVPCGIITDKDIGSLGRFQVIIVPDMIMMDEREARAFEGFVRSGGALYVSRRTSLIGKDGVRRPNFLLAELLGVDYLGETDETVTYLAPSAGAEALFWGHCRKYPLMISDRQAKVRAGAGTSTLATLTLPFSRPGDTVRFSAAISNPPGIETEFPSLVMKSCGSGKTIYSSAGIEMMEHESHRSIFVGLIRMLMSRPPVYELLDAPKSVEATVFHQAAHNRFIINLLNFQQELPNIPVDGIRIRLSLPGRKIKQLLKLPDEEGLDYSFDGNILTFTAPRLKTFLMFAVDYT